MQTPADTAQKNEIIEAIALPSMASEPPEARLGERVKYIRKERKFNIEYLSRLTKEYDQQGGGLSPSSISRYETGEGLPGIREFRLLCEALDIPSHWLMYGFLDDEAPNQIEKFLLTALRSYVRANGTDSPLMLGDGDKWMKQQARDIKLAKAK